VVERQKQGRLAQYACGMAGVGCSEESRRWSWTGPVSDRTTKGWRLRHSNHHAQSRVNSPSPCWSPQESGHHAVRTNAAALVTDDLVSCRRGLWTACCVHAPRGISDAVWRGQRRGLEADDGAGAGRVEAGNGEELAARCQQMDSVRRGMKCESRSRQCRPATDTRMEGQPDASSRNPELSPSARLHAPVGRGVPLHQLSRRPFLAQRPVLVPC